MIKTYGGYNSYNEYMREYVRRRYLLLKMKAIEYKGGKCIKCGYTQCPACLTFHHRDPSQKDFDWDQMRKRSWETIKQELDKCDLLCCRCHTENHYDGSILHEASIWMGERRRDVSLIGQVRKCNYCGKDYTMKRGDNRFRRYCSPLCSKFVGTKGKWMNDDELIRLSNNIGMVQVGKIVGVSANAVKKRLDRIRLGLPVSFKFLAENNEIKNSPPIVQDL